MVVARSVRGMNDLFEADLLSFRHIEKHLEKLFHTFGYQEIRTPILEELMLFKRSVGESSDIVEKEMFLVEDNEHHYCLRPENTAPVVRALIERGIVEETQEKLYYVGPMFRKERPQKGRLRQFHQFGIELFGVVEPAGDIEVIFMVHQLFETLAILPEVTLKINSLGTAEERQKYKHIFREFLRDVEASLCEDCKRRLLTNPLRVLDCKHESCQQLTKNAPKILDVLGEDSRLHFKEVLEGLSHQKIPYQLDHSLVRGLDYYNRTVFEFVANTGLGAQNTLAAGGRYDGLFVTLGHKTDLPALGCAGGLERIAMLLIKPQPDLHAMQIALMGADDEGRNVALDLAFDLRKAGIATDLCLIKKSLKAQMRRADKLNCEFVGIIGEDERRKSRIKLKRLADKYEIELPMSAVALIKFFEERK